MVEENVDAAIEFQRHVDVSPVIADIFGTAGVPLIAVHIPHPGAIYFGVDNYKCGYAAGTSLADAARRRWNGQVDLILLLDIPEGGIVLESRMTGALRAIETALGPQPPGIVHRVSGGGERSRGRAAAAAILSDHPEARHILVSACSDDGALGALDALTAAGRESQAVIAGMEGSAEALEMIAREESPYIASVAFYPEQYGPALMDLVLRLVNGEQVPPFRYVDHELIDREKALRLLRPEAGAPDGPRLAHAAQRTGTSA
jgi:ribose transport system substrate-binding protein